MPIILCFGKFQPPEVRVVAPINASHVNYNSVTIAALPVPGNLEIQGSFQQAARTLGGGE